MRGPVLIRDILHARKEVPFYNQIDLAEIEDDILIGVSGNLTAGYKLEGIDLAMKSHEEIDAALDFLRKTLGHLPEKTQYQFIVKHRPGPGKALYDYRKEIRANDAFTRTLVDTKFESLKASRLFSTTVYLFITKLHEGKKKLTDHFSVSNPKTKKISKEDFENRKAGLYAAKSHLENAFGNIKVRLSAMKEKEYKTFFYFHLNPARAVQHPLGRTGDHPLQNITLRSSLLFSAPTVERESICQDGFYYQGINLLLPPESTDVVSLRRMLDRLEMPFDFSFSFYVPDNEKEIEQLRTRANVSKTFGFLGGSKNYDAVQKFAEIDALITEIKASTQKLVYYSACFLIRDKTVEALTRKQNQILEVFPVLGSADGIADHMNHDRLYLSFLPGQAWMNERKYLIQTDALVNLLPVQCDWKGSESAKILLKSRKSQLLKLDLFDPELPAKHGIVLGTTGSGKSFATNYFLLSYLLENPKNQLIVIDVGNSYRRLASIFKGSYFDIDLGEKYSINPLLPRDAVFQGREPDSEKLAYLSMVAEKLVRGRPDEVLENSHKRILEKAILKVYETNQHPLLGDLLRVLAGYSLGDEQEKRRAQEFAKNLALWTDGRYGKLLNRQGNLDASSRFLVFELGKLDAYPDLQSVIFFVIRSAITTKLYDRSCKKVIVIDEGWRFFNDEIGSRLIEDLYRTARKHDGLVLSISQSPEDFLNTKAANAIISNSFTKYVLKLNKGYDLLPKFDLTDSEVEEVKSLSSRPGHYSELLIKYGQNSAVARIEPTPLEYWIATTDPQDCRLESFVREENPNLDSITVLQHLADMYPKGVKKYGSAK